MATFLLVHGAWHGGWCFDALAAELVRRGHRAIAPDLPGMGGDTTPCTDVTLAGWGAFIADMARAQNEKVILLGHSRGGVVISEAAERAPDAIAALVYLSAFLVPSGRSMNDLVTQAPRSDIFDDGLSLHADGASLVLDAQAAVPVFYHLCDAAAAARAAARLVPEPLAPLSTPLQLSEERYGRVPRHYIECAQDQAIPLSQQREMQRALPCVSSVTLESDHSPFIGCPGRVADALGDIASRYRI